MAVMMMTIERLTFSRCRRARAFEIVCRVININLRVDQKSRLVHTRENARHLLIGPLIITRCNCCRNNPRNVTL